MFFFNFVCCFPQKLSKLWHNNTSGGEVTMQTQELMEEIEKKRELLSKTIYKNGLELNNQEVLACSQELDKLIAEYLRLLSLNMVAKKRSNPVI